VLLADLDACGQDSLLARRIATANQASADVPGAPDADGNLVSGNAESAS